MVSVLFIVVGLACGTLAGLIGIAGGIFLIPLLIYIFGFSQKMAQGTTLAVMLPPIGLAAAFLYYRQGNVSVKAAMFIAVGFFVGGFFGASMSSHFSNETLTRIFGLATLAVSVKMLLFP
ncbi:MAG: hypothetical protein JWN01_873 [Patescibacteria group bacterium]|nr:hypothetical protein [Patescibacteria group bacterium]